MLAASMTYTKLVEEFAATGASAVLGPRPTVVTSVGGPARTIFTENIAVTARYFSSLSFFPGDVSWDSRKRSPEQPARSIFAGMFGEIILVIFTDLLPVVGSVRVLCLSQRTPMK